MSELDDLMPYMVEKESPYTVVGHDHATGLPVMKRKGAEAKQPEPEPESEPEPEQEEKPAAPVEENNLPATPVVESKPQSALHKPVAAKGTAVRLPDGTTGKLAFSDGVNARVRTDDGRSVNAKHKDITPMTKVAVKAHTRMVPARNDQ